ncbi:MAG: ribonuclease H-like domain-containing protein [Rhodospirillales bacterium]|nr:ribonuclease H-like domain-containing protein [Rhodospirillales bacterium]
MAERPILVFDLETVPDVHAYGATAGLEGHPERTVREQMGDKFPRQIFHRIVCIGALEAHRMDDGAWQVRSLAAPHLGERSEHDMIQDLVDRISDLDPRLVTFNGVAFDLPVLRYRAMIHAIAAPGLARRRYFERFGPDTVDLCDMLSGFERHARVTLHQLSRVLGLPGKPEGVDGSDVETMVRAGRLDELARYCTSDVVNTYRIWLRYELFRGRLGEVEFAASEGALAAFLAARSGIQSPATAPH